MEAINYIFVMMQRFVTFLDRPILKYNNFDISLWDINFVFLLIGLIAAVFWRGART